MRIEKLLPNDKNAKYAIILIWCVMVAQLISIAASYFHYNLLQTLIDGEIYFEDTIETSEENEFLFSLLYVFAYIISTITFIKWFRSAYYNLSILTPNLSYNVGWSIGGWFIPILSYYIPYKIMKEIYFVTETLLINTEVIKERKLSYKFLNWWWFFWVVDWLFGNYVLKYNWKAESLMELQTGTLLSIISGILTIPTGLLAIQVIKEYSKLEPLLIEIQNETNIINQNESNILNIE